MKSSKEYFALKKLERGPPEQSEPGDMWRCRRLGMVALALGSKRKRRNGYDYAYTFLYHWGEPSLITARRDWEMGPDTMTIDASHTGYENWVYCGNIFDLLPYETLSGVPYRGANIDR